MVITHPPRLIDAGSPSSGSSAAASPQHAAGSASFSSGVARGIASLKKNVESVVMKSGAASTRTSKSELVGFSRIIVDTLASFEVRRARCFDVVRRAIRECAWSVVSWATCPVCFLRVALMQLTVVLML